MKVACLLAPILACVAIMGPAAAQQSETASAEAFYRDRTLTILSGSDVGGGYDAYARLVSRHLPAHLPGKVRMIVQNLPGGGGIHAANTLSNMSAKDGSVLGFLQRGILTAPLLDPRSLNLQYDPRKFNWLQSLNSESGLIIVAESAPQKTAADLFQTELTVGSSGPATEIMPRLLRNQFGMKLKIVSGYKGSAEAYLALERGEVQGRISTGFDKAVLTPWLAQGHVRLLLSLSLKKHPYFSDLPLVTDFAKTAEDRGTLELLLTEQAAGRPILMPPDVPQERVRFMRRALTDMVSDPAFLSEAKSLNLDIDVVSGEDIARMLDRLYAIPPEIVAKARETISSKN